MIDLTGLSGRKLAGYTLDKFIDQGGGAHWYEAHADDLSLALVYVYTDASERDRGRANVHGFKTTSNERLPDIETHLFLTIGAHRITMACDLRDALRSADTRPKAIGDYVLDEVLGHGFKGVTFKARRATGPSTPYALKLTIAEEYEGKTYIPEVENMVNLAANDRDHFPQIHHCGNYDFSFNSQTCPLVYFVEDFIRGESLGSVLSESPSTLDAHFLYTYITEMLAAIATMHSLQLMHDDLHSGNVMLHQPLTGKQRPYVIDFGSAKSLEHTRKDRDDIRNFATHVAAIVNAIQDQVTARTLQEDRILQAAASLLPIISEDDPLQRHHGAKELYERFERAFNQGAMKQTLKHPFDFGNAEEVMDNELLYSLSAKSFPWRDHIEVSAHLLVIGPRGSGKTTVFRSMSTKCLCDAGEHDDASKRPYVGLYISCNKEFRTRFSAISPSIFEKRQDDVRNYFHLVVLREYISSLAAFVNNSSTHDADVHALVEFIAENTHLLEGAYATGSLTLSGLEALATRAVHEARMALWNDADLPRSTAQGFLADLADLSASRIGAFAGKTLYLFVDDYTDGKVPLSAQRALNHILFVPNSSYKCKISAEVFGVAFDQTYGDFVAKDRDYKEWNLGTLYYLKLPTREQKEFLREIVDNRLALCNFEGRVESIIGGSSYASGTVARSLKDEAEARRLKRSARKGGAPIAIIEKEVNEEVESEGSATYYHGWDTICELCTGDVSNILELLNRMFEECNVKANSKSAIIPQHQNAVIETYSRQFIAKIKGIPAYGEQLFEVVNAFGNMAKRLLEDHPWLDRGPNRRDPYQLLRIELDESGSEGSESEPMQVWRMLQRYCLFVDADGGRSRRNTLSGRVVLRRILCPAFRIGLTSSESWTVSPQQWTAFCDNPTRFAETQVRRTLEKKTVISDEQRLFDSF
jgi:hypothetical protein